MKFITVSNKPHPGLELYKESARQCGIDPIILGMGDNRSLGHEMGGYFGVKLEYVSEYLKTLDNKDELILFTDAWDVVFVDGPQLIERKARLLLEKSKALAIFAAEKYESPKSGYPYTTLQNKYTRTFPYLNSGVYVGTANNLLYLLKRFNTWPKEQQLITDDQEYFVSEYFASNSPHTIALDHDCLLFACMLHSDALVLGNKVVMPHSRTMPSILHFQGWEKNILPFVPASLLSLAAPLQQYNKKNIIKKSIEWVGEHIVPKSKWNPFYRGLFFILYICIFFILSIIK
jgi:hypothetical protein